MAINLNKPKFVLSGRRELLKGSITQLLALHQLTHGKDIGEVYGIPTDVYQESVTFKPQVKLFFKQDEDAVPPKMRAVRAELTFRLQDKTSATITPGDAMALATAIKQEFVSGGSTGFTWSKGKIKTTYFDRDKGYELYIFALNKVEGEKVVKKILDIRGHPYDSEKLVEHVPTRQSINNPTGHRMVYGELVDNIRWRPTANVRFQWASLQIHGKLRDIFLVDITAKHPEALLKAN